MEAEQPPQPPQEEEGSLDAPEGELPPEEAGEGLEDELQPDAPTFPEEIILAKLAIRALHFNIKSKRVHVLKLRDEGQIIPFEKISDYFEQTKKIPKILGFVEWAMNRYEGANSKWLADNEPNIVSSIQQLNNELPPEQKLDNNNRLEWTRIILNCLLRGSPNFSLNISEVNETTVREIRNMLLQAFGNDSRGMFAGLSDIRGPGTF